MKITETVERECCSWRTDLKIYRGRPILGYTEKVNRLRFCVHCGQLWHWIRAPGEMDAGYEKLPETQQ